MAKDKTLEDLFHDTLKDIYFAEKNILTALPKLAKAAEFPDLKAAFEKHVVETEGQVERLEEVFEIIGKPARGKTCPAILELVEEGQEVAKEDERNGKLHGALFKLASMATTTLCGRLQTAWRCIRVAGSWA